MACRGTAPGVSDQLGSWEPHGPRGAGRGSLLVCPALLCVVLVNLVSSLGWKALPSRQCWG